MIEMNQYFQGGIGMITILLADDDPHIRSIVIEYAQAEDWQFIEAEDGLAAFMDEQGVDYLVTFPGWYPRLSAGRVPVYQSNANFAPRAGGENMAVYHWGGLSK